MRHDAGRLLDARPPGGGVRGGGQHAARARHAAPGHRRVAGALHRDFDRALRRRAAGLARADAGGGGQHQ